MSGTMCADPWASGTLAARCSHSSLCAPSVGLRHCPQARCGYCIMIVVQKYAVRAALSQAPSTLTNVRTTRRVSPHSARPKGQPRVAYTPVLHLDVTPSAGGTSTRRCTHARALSAKSPSRYLRGACVRPPRTRVLNGAGFRGSAGTGPLPRHTVHPPDAPASSTDHIFECVAQRAELACFLRFLLDPESGSGSASSASEG
ncbi:hypothetical protein BV20DRAFT_334675 [Pilatotrama ljubarskyi]|nr:hypothetical protein BV20DRAFT_334675 [Pilatotrama ljubarskyi]